MVDLVAGTPASVAYSGSAVEYVVKAAGQVDIYLWGGAGSGGYYANGSGNANKFGGAGGYTNARFMVDVGDIITVEVGQGGRVPTGSGTTASAGGLGGWPDGGFGAINSGAAWVAPGGGGGSTRIYKNGDLVAVAGGGGGATGFYSGGNGGGALGMASTDASSGAGGTQLAGGVAGSGTLAVQSGGYFRGGQASTAANVSNAYTGGGGGGGFYGGASNGGGSGAHGSGGGGSGWLSQATDVAGACRVAPQDGTGAPINPAGITIPAGTAQGGVGPTVASTGWASITPGGNGFAYLALTDIGATASALPSGSSTLSYTGTRQVYEVTDICSVDFEMWGGGGGGGFYTSGGNAARFGGAAGYTKLTRILYPGDIVEVEVAQGGQAPSGVSQTGGAGGWPNGGSGGRPAAAAPNFGGGGGSTNVWVNGRLLAIAAGGGGSTGFYYGGVGGGRFGLQSTDQTTNNGTGGTWGGVNAVSSQGRGYFLQGGHGSPIESPTVAIATAGAGGGGGYYGGGGAKGGSGTHGSGGGGCGYTSGDNTYNRVMQAGTPATGAPYDPGTKPAGVGVGGTGGSSAGTTGPGGDGAINLTVTPLTSLPTLPTGKTVFSFTNAAEHYVAGTTGLMALKVWGAGGGGCTRSSGTLRRGGGGGFFKVDIVKINQGDIVTFVVGEGGKGMPGPNLGGRGGFPNGEYGNAGDATGGNAGGGGSSHVYINGKLVGVAGGGGGGAISFDGGTAGLASYPPSGDGFGPSGSSLFYGGFSPQRGAEGNNRGVFMLAGIGQIDGGTIDTPNNLAGGGGGGGYWGGAGSAPNNSRFQPGGPGSTYITANYVGTQQAGTTSGTNLSDPDWGSSASVGGQGSNTPGNSVTNGGHGRIVCSFDIPTLLNESVSANVPVASAVQTFMVGNDGTITLKAWGAGGGGSMMTANSGSELAGGGGYAAATLDLKKGQILRVYNGAGGNGAVYTSGVSGAFVGTGGPGGWPDGGQGGMHVSGIFGGGGGSSRVYVDDILLLVAGGGGGGGIHTATTTAGGGGGTTGGNSDTVTVFNTGGQTYRGGWNTGRTTDATTSGSGFKGGAGYLAGSTASTSNIAHGGGGGGGLYGGSGSGSTNASSTGWLGGAGGSGFVADGWDVTEYDYLRDYVVLQYSFDTPSGVADDARKLNTLLLDTAPTTTTSGPKFGTTCLTMSAGHLTTDIPAIGQQDFTLEGWFNPASLTTGVMMIIGDQSINGLSLHYYPSATVLGLRYNNADPSGATLDTKYTDSARAANVWAHYAISRDINGTRVYKDGILVSTTTGSPFSITATTLTLGNYRSIAGASTRFVGKIDEVRLTVGVARYRQNFKPQQFRNKRTLGLTGASTVQAGSSGNGLPASTGVSGYAAGRGVGAAVKTTPANGNPGGDGQINYFLATSTVAATGPIGTVQVGGLITAAAGAFYPLPAAGTTVVHPYTGSRYNYSVDDPGGARIKVEMWGAGGGGCSATNSSTSTGGGGGGYTVYEMDLVQGDKITLQTPSGGFGSNTAGGSDASGINAGGYPDGGNGYRPAFTAFNGGGGGSARMWAGGDLAAVAGGGGGGAYGSVAYDFAGGPGGGSSGGSGGYDGVNATFPNTGGTQSVGGTGTPNGVSGSFMQGGVGGTTISVANNGPGGGGGYYGGGGGGAYKAAGGGSGYINTTLSGYRTGSTSGGSGNLPGGMGSPNYASGIGVGSNGKAGVRDGGNGRIVLTVITPTPGNAAGLIGTVNVSGLNTFGTLVGTPTGAIGTVNVVVPVGTSGQPAFASGVLPVIGLGPPETIPQAQAIVIVPINDQTSLLVSPPDHAPFAIDAEGTGDLGTITVTSFNSTQTAAANATPALPTVTLTAPEADAVEIPPVLASGALVTIPVTAPEASTQVIPPVETSGDIGTITLVTLNGDASTNNNVATSGDIGTITLTALDGSAQGDDLAEGLIGTITVTVPTAVVQQSAEATGDIGTISVYAIEGGQPADASGDIGTIQIVPLGVSVNASSGDDVNLYVDPGLIYVVAPFGQGFWISEDNFVHALPDPLVVSVTTPTGSARGDVRMVGSFAPIILSKLDGSAGGDGLAEPYTGDWIILVSPPVPQTELNANVNVAMPPPIVINGNDAEASLDITVPFSDTAVFITGPEALGLGFHGGQLGPPILVTPPAGGPEISANGIGQIGTIGVEPPRFHYIPPITVIPPEGVALDAKSAQASGSLGTITIGVPTGGYQAAVAINLPLPTIFVTTPQAMVFASVAISGALSTITLTPPVASLTAGANASFTLPGPIVLTSPEATATAGTAASTSGALTTITLTAPTGSVATGSAASATGSIGTITVTPFDGSVFISYPGFATGAIGTITLTPPAATVSNGRNLSLAFPGPIVVTSPVAVPRGSVAITGTIGTITLTAPIGTATGDTIFGTGDIGTITVTGINGAATGRGLGTGAIGTIVVTPPAATLTTGANKSVALPGPIVVTAPTGVGRVPSATSGALGTITITSTPEATVSAGQGLSGQIGTITITPPEAQGQGAVFIQATDELVVQTLPPQAILFQEATVIVGFPTIYLVAPEAITYSLAEFASITLLPPDAYVTVPLPLGKNRIRYRRNNTAGHAPASLLPHEIALNETDGLLFTRDGAGAVKSTPLGFMHGEGLPPPATDDGKVLSGGMSWETPFTQYLLPVRNAPPAGARIALAEGVVGTTTFTPTLDVTYTRPFFVAKTIDIQALSIEVVGTAVSTAELGLIGWSLTGTPGAAIVTGTVSTSTAGVKSAAGTATVLTPGWYAATFKVTGAAGASFRAPTTPTAIAPDFTTAPGAPAPVMATLET
ncbi:putative lectin-like domain protein [Caulobacter phage CcrRogue]|uniref:receptor protein-tyrosine kinase n=1 Tax=Caulobacter phage CcrRogue TaxID=2927986 RepID=K4JQK2_9CAUD|nr:putative lectin-like domain protein [Caulobacter phage CcrRogue]AFU86560.1 putative lectin-like domain protein [Caulobacter phage CcrRogue]